MSVRETNVQVIERHFPDRESAAMILSMEHADREPASPDDDRPSLVRVMAVRALLLGVSLGGIFMVAIASGHPHDFDRWRALGSFTAGVMAGATLSLGVLCEKMWHGPNFHDALAAALGTSAIAFVAALFAVLEIPYVIAMAQGGTPAAALGALEDGWHRLVQDTHLFLGLALMAAPIFGVTTFARTLRVRGPWWILIAALSPVTSVPGVLLFRPKSSDEPILAFGIAGCAVFVPLVAAAAERLEHDLRART